MSKLSTERLNVDADLLADSQDEDTDAHLSWAEVREQLDELSRLQSNWDSYGAHPIAAHTIQKAERLLVVICDALRSSFGERALPTDVVPVADGTVHLCWESESGELTLKVVGDGPLGYFQVDRSDGTRRTSGDSDIAESVALHLVTAALAA